MLRQYNSQKWSLQINFEGVHYKLAMPIKFVILKEMWLLDDGNETYFQKSISNSPDPLSLVVLCLLAFLKETNSLEVFLEFKVLLIRARDFPVGIHLLKVNNRNGRARCEICSKLTIKTPERLHWRRFCVFIVNFEHISHIVLVLLLLTLNM